MRQASNRAAKTVISLQCWDQESERGAVISAVLATTTILLYKIGTSIFLPFLYIKLIYLTGVYLLTTPLPDHGD